MGVTSMCWQSWVNSGDCTEACPGSIHYRNLVAGSEKWRLVCWEMVLCFYTFSWAFGVGGDKICFEDEWARTCQACVLLGWWLEWVLHGTAFESALVSYTAVELPILYFSFNNGVNDFLYCRLKKTKKTKKNKKKPTKSGLQLLIWMYFCQILGCPGIESLNSWFFFLDRHCSNTDFSVSLAASNWSPPKRQSLKKLGAAPYLFWTKWKRE